MRVGDFIHNQRRHPFFP